MKTIVLDRMIVATAACAALFMLRCANISGGGSEAGNARITGWVQNTQGSPVGNVMITVRPSDFDPVKSTALPGSYAAITGTDGRFEIAVRQGGTYSIQAVFTSAGTRALIAAVTVGDTDIAAPSCTLNAPSCLKVMLPDSADHALGYVYVPGTSVYAFLKNAEGFVIMDSVPAGVIPALSYSSKNNSASTVLRYDVPVFPGDTAVVYNPLWNYAQTLFLNTAASGAQVSGDVNNFPVLVRLSSANFAFARAKADGGDLRFSKSDGRSLPFEIERWDPVSGLAEVWVKIDTVRGNDSSQSIVMYWGNPSAAGLSNGAAVFDSAGGFAGVWHLSETSGTLAADASYNGFSGVYMDKIPENVVGPFGICQYFAPSDSDYVDMGDVLNPGIKNITIGVWIKRASFGLPQALIAKTVGGAPSATYGYQLSIDQANFPHFFMASGGTSWGNDSAFDIAGNLAISDSTAWHFVLVVIDRSINGNCRVYIDGIDRTGSAYGNVTHVDNVTNTLRLRIGSENNTFHFYRGAIGGATIAFTARSADWVKLSYMNQKGQDALVKW